MEVETLRLRLRPLALDDLEDLHRLQSDAEMMRFFDDGPYIREQTRTWLEWHIAMWDQEGFSFWAAELKPDLRFIGWLGLDKVWEPIELLPAIEAGWFIDRQHWGQGLATEGAQMALAFGFDQLGLDRIIARYNSENVASGRVMEKIGMHLWRQMQNDDPATVTNIYEALASPREVDEH